MAEQKERRGSWGGPRPNSGRPRLGDAVRSSVNYALPPELIALVQQRAEREGVSRSEALVRCLREWAAAQP